jgi:hypothetical protein
VHDELGLQQADGGVDVGVGAPGGAVPREGVGVGLGGDEVVEQLVQDVQDDEGACDVEDALGEGGPEGVREQVGEIDVGLGDEGAGAVLGADPIRPSVPDTLRSGSRMGA